MHAIRGARQTHQPAHDQKPAEHDGERTTLSSCLQQGSDDPSGGAHQAEPPQQAAVHVFAQDPESERCGGGMRNRDRSHSRLRPHRKAQERRQETPNAEAAH